MRFADICILASLILAIGGVIAAVTIISQQSILEGSPS